MKKQPEVTAQTRKKLIDAFWNIYCENGIHQTTVGAVTRSAGFNRGTFYEYFTDLYDLLGQLENDLLQDISAQVKQKFKDDLPKSFREFSNTCAHIFSLYGDKIYILLGSQGDPAFQAKLQNELRPVMLSIAGLSKEEPYLDYLTAFGFSAMLGLVSHWYENGREIEIEKLFQLIQSLVATGVLGYTKRNLFDNF
ncbi:MAG: TetR/AcrR family transcriptional regulator [Clostridiales bacterium]|nr:TetR/AcrR family transcriptional regulator [Clostridiales bacterium]